MVYSWEGLVAGTEKGFIKSEPLLFLRLRVCSPRKQKVWGNGVGLTECQGAWQAVRSWANSPVSLRVKGEPGVVEGFLGVLSKGQEGLTAPLSFDPPPRGTQVGLGSWPWASKTASCGRRCCRT